MNNQLSVRNNCEVDKLGTIIIHRPDDGVEVITPDNALEFLYDDIVYLDLIRKEHEVLQKILTAFVGEDNVLEFEQLLSEMLMSIGDEIKQLFLDEIFKLENTSSENKDKIYSLNNTELTYTLITGIHRKERKSILPPLPNLVFTRDIAVAIKDHILICQHSNQTRMRESIMTKYILMYNPRFKESQLNDFSRIIDMTQFGKEYSLEGGDVMIFNNDYLLVGCSERSTPEAFDKLKSILFEKEIIDNVVKIEIPKDRSCMHIDTLFTQISKNEFVIFNHTLTSEDIKVEQYTSDGQMISFNNLRDFFHTVNPKMKFILCGDGQYPHDEREQWTDGCNLVALKDGIAIAYHRNTRTAKALEKEGYRIIKGEELLDCINNEQKTLVDFDKTIITLESSELSRARGGPHCMTCPIERL